MELFICIFFVIILLVTSACTRLQSQQHDNRSIEMEVIMSDDECIGRVTTSNTQGEADDHKEIKGPR
jgi:hypothetical protein